VDTDVVSTRYCNISSLHLMIIGNVVRDSAYDTFHLDKQIVKQSCYIAMDTKFIRFPTDTNTLKVITVIGKLIIVYNNDFPIL
jgi:hypothetical protein